MDFKYIFLISAVHLTSIRGDWSLYVGKCCSKGSLWLNSNGQACPSFSRSLPDIPRQYYEMCVSVLSICCLVTRKEKTCDIGIDEARQHLSCSSFDRKNLSGDEKECCQCCYFGILLSKFNLPCAIRLKSIDSRCQLKLALCCDKKRQYQTTRNYRVIPQNPKVYSENICGAYPEKLCSHFCENVPGSFICRCKEGYELLSDNKNCRLKERVVVAVKCKSGFALQSKNICEDINECLQDNKCLKNEKCVNLEGSYKCEKVESKPIYPVYSCGTGFVYNESRLSCEDINECLKGQKCDNNEVCVNTQGSYQCIKLHNISCKVGYYFDNSTNQCEDFNECITAFENCPIGMKCFNTIGSYTCKRARECGTGYKLNTVNDECEDIDECILNIHDCGSSRTCKNIVGSFRCLTTNCSKGHKFSDVFQGCEPIKCLQGMELNDKDECIDINECLKNPHICPKSQNCENTLGSYKCVDVMECPIGFVLNKTQNGCIDINECATSSHKCTFKNQLCNNTIGSYICSCPSGTEVNRISKECKDINECTQKISACSAHTTCENTYGSYRCVCRDGFKLEGNECKDDNECSRKETCQHICTNVWGSFRCTCKPGYKLAADNRSCEDLDECKIKPLLRGKEACDYNCTNEIGSFNCSCPPGYYTTTDFKCSDVDECNTYPNVCNSSSKICINLKGSFRCEEPICNFHYNMIVKENSLFKLVECNRKTCDRSDSHCMSSPLVIQFLYLSFSTAVSIPYAITQLTMPDEFKNSFQSKLTQFMAYSRQQNVALINQNYFQLTESYSQGKNAFIIEMIKKINFPCDISFEVITQVVDPGADITFVTHLHIYITKTPFD